MFEVESLRCEAELPIFLLLLELHISYHLAKYLRRLKKNSPAENWNVEFYIGSITRSPSVALVRHY